MIDLLLAELDGTKTWPLKRECEYLERVELRRAFRVRDVERLKARAGWVERFTASRRDYFADSLPSTIARSWGSFLFGESPELKPAAESDAENLDRLEDANKLDAMLPRAVRLAVSEGEAWWHVFTDEIASPDAPILEVTSRLRVVPYWRGRTATAVAFVTTVECHDETHYRLFEIHEIGRVANVLYRGERRKLGSRVPLATLDSTADIADDWRHGLPVMLAGRIVNDVEGEERLGYSEFDDAVDYFLALNEARTIGVENARLTAKRRLYVGANLAKPGGGFDAGIDVYAVETPDGELGKDSTPPVQAIDYAFDAAPLLEWIRSLEVGALTRCGIVRGLVDGDDVAGNGASGTAIRLRYMPTIQAAEAKGKEWDVAVPNMLRALSLVDALPVTAGGMGHAWSDADTLVTVERGEPMPSDEGEVVDLNAAAVAARIRSRETAIREQHPEWPDVEVAAELARIDADAAGDRAIMPTIDGLGGIAHAAPLDPTLDPPPPGNAGRDTLPVATD